MKKLTWSPMGMPHWDLRITVCFSTLQNFATRKILHYFLDCPNKKLILSLGEYMTV